MSLIISRFTLRCGVHLVSGIAMALASCTGATGRGWVGEAQYGRSREIGSSPAQAISIPGKVELEAQEAARPRLNHTVTLGELDVAPTVEGAGEAPGVGWGTPSVTINNYNVVSVATPAVYGYAAVGYGRALPSFSTGNAARASSPTVTPGQSWPAIADHGPSFPYHSGPASPWAHPQ